MEPGRAVMPLPRPASCHALGGFLGPAVYVDSSGLVRPASE
jgi:hypothetical protein